MELRYRRIENLPRLAWCARLDAGSPVVRVTHGPWVEARERFFVEGVWDGPFVEGGFDRTCRFMGTGGRLSGDRVVFATPCHTLERLHLCRRGSSVFVSNSLAFVITAAGLELDPDYPRYKVDLNSVMHGIEGCRAEIPTRGGPPVRLLHYRNVEIGSDLRVVERPKPMPPAWENFADYRAFLAGGLAAFRDNLDVPERVIRYRFLASVSTGYDSTATAALATDVGCREGVTFHTGRSYFEGAAEVPDNGAAIGRGLGIEMREFPLYAYLERSELAQAEFAACGDCCDSHLAALEDELPGRVLLSGAWGDRIWNRHNARPGATIVRRDPSGSSMTEFRLRLGFVHVAVTFFGATRLPSVHAISNSAEMQPWTLGVNYDRPIPRRIVEEAGVPRSWFGQTKQGAFSNVDVTRGRPSSLASFERFYERYRRERTWRSSSLAELRYWAASAARLATRASDEHGVPRLVPRTTSWDVATPGRPSFMVQWGNAVVQERYR